MKILFTTKEMESTQDMAKNIMALINATNPKYKIEQDKIDEMMNSIFTGTSANSKMYTTELTDEGCTITYNEEFVIDIMDMYVKVAEISVSPVSKLVTKCIKLIDDNKLIGKIFTKVCNWFSKTSEMEELKTNFMKLSDEFDTMMSKYTEE